MTKQSDLEFMKDWELRKELTNLNKARLGAKSNPTGLTRLTLEAMDREERIIRAEMTKRKERRRIET